MISKNIIKITTPDGVDIALWKISNKKTDLQEHIFLTHGTFSDKNICLGIAGYFANLGYTCWVMEWRNHGKSSRSKKNLILKPLRNTT